MTNEKTTPDRVGSVSYGADPEYNHENFLRQKSHNTNENPMFHVKHRVFVQLRGTMNSE